MDTSSDILRALGLDPAALTGGTLAARSPIDGAELAQVREPGVAQAHAAITRARQASLAWRDVPPRRGELLRLFGETLRGLARAGPAGEPGGRQDPGRGRRRSAGK